MATKCSQTADYPNLGATTAYADQKRVDYGVISLSGTSTDFNGLASDLYKIRVSMWAISLTTADACYIRLGTASAFETSGYVNYYTHLVGTTASGTPYTTVFRVSMAASAANSNFGHFELLKFNNNYWSFYWLGTDGGRVGMNAGAKGLSGALTRIRFETGSGTFDAGYARCLGFRL